MDLVEISANDIWEPVNECYLRALLEEPVLHAETLIRLALHRVATKITFFLKDNRQEIIGYVLVDNIVKEWTTIIINGIHRMLSAARDYIDTLDHARELRIDYLPDRDLNIMIAIFPEAATPELHVYQYEFPGIFPKPEINDMSRYGLDIQPFARISLQRLLHFYQFSETRFSTDVFAELDGMCLVRLPANKIKLDSSIDDGVSSGFELTACVYDTLSILPVSVQASCIGGVKVRDNFRNMSLCKQLLRAFLNHLKAKNKDEISLFVHSDNLLACKCYEKVGFKMIQSLYRLRISHA